MYYAIIVRQNEAHRVFEILTDGDAPVSNTEYEYFEGSYVTVLVTKLDDDQNYILSHIRAETMATVLPFIGEYLKLEVADE